MLLDVTNSDRISSSETGLVAFTNSLKIKHLNNQIVFLIKQRFRNFGEYIWGVSKQHNASPEWLSSLRKKYCGFSEQGNITISEADVAGRVRRMANWKATGLDCVQVYWLKHLSNLHSCLAKQFQDLLDQEEALPKWLVTGRTTLIMKSPDKCPVASNYRPITCFPAVWRLLSGILADKLIDFLDKTNIMAPE